MVDGQEGRRLGRPFDQRAERHLLAGQRRFDEDMVERLGSVLELGQHLHDHVVAVDLGEVLRDLPLAEGVVKRVVDQLRLDSESRGLIAVDRQGQRRAAGLLVGGDAGQLRQRLQLRHRSSAPID